MDTSLRIAALRIVLEFLQVRAQHMGTCVVSTLSDADCLFCALAVLSGGVQLQLPLDHPQRPWVRVGCLTHVHPAQLRG